MLFTLKVDVKSKGDASLISQVSRRLGATVTVKRGGPIAKKAATRKGHFTFDEVNIAKGEEIVSDFDPSVKAKVCGPRRIKFGDEEMSLSASAMILARKVGKSWPRIQGPYWWRYKGKRLTDLREAA